MAPSEPLGDEFSSTTSLWLDQGPRQYQFVAEVIALATPRNLATVAQRMRRQAEGVARAVPSLEWQRLPLVVAPFLSEARLLELMADKVSGLDLCGNGVLIAENLFVFKTGQKNRYPQSTKLRNAYQGISSLVPRALLIQTEFAGVKDMVEFINGRGGAISSSQVSKALKQVEEDLFVSRDEGVIKLIQPEPMLDALATKYKPPRITDRWLGRCDVGSFEGLFDNIRMMVMEESGRISKTGACSAENYAAFAGEPMLSVYTDQPLGSLLNNLGLPIEEGRRFANLEIIQTNSPWAFFDSGQQFGKGEASEVQTYVELANGDKRQQQAAEQIRDRILSRFGNSRW